MYALKNIQAIDDLEDEEKEDYYIKDTDTLIVAGKIVKKILYSGEIAFQSLGLYL